MNPWRCVLYITLNCFSDYHAEFENGGTILTWLDKPNAHLRAIYSAYRKAFR